MNIQELEQFDKLEKEIDNENFTTDYKNTNTIFKILSYFGNIASIYLAYFFMHNVMSVPFAGLEFVIILVTLILLGGIELLKRSFFNKFSNKALKTKKFMGEVIPLFVISLLLISMSFYSSLNGAKEFSSKTNEIDLKSDLKIKNVTDSLTLVLNNNLKPIELEINQYKQKLESKDKEQYLINKSLLDVGYLTTSQKQRNIQLTEEKNILDNKIDKLDKNINVLKTNNTILLNKSISKINKTNNKNKTNNNRNSLIFVIISTIVEFTILFGIFFDNYYKLRSYNEQKKILNNDINYLKWKQYDKILKIIYPINFKDNTKLPNNKTMIDMCKINDLNILSKDMTNFLKLMTSLDIIKSTTNGRYITKQRDVAIEGLQKYFLIK